VRQLGRGRGHNPRGDSGVADLGKKNEESQDERRLPGSKKKMNAREREGEPRLSAEIGCMPDMSGTEKEADAPMHENTRYPKRLEGGSPRTV